MLKILLDSVPDREIIFERTQIETWYSCKMMQNQKHVVGRCVAIFR